MENINKKKIKKIFFISLVFVVLLIKGGGLVMGYTVVPGNPEDGAETGECLTSDFWWPDGTAGAPITHPCLWCVHQIDPHYYPDGQGGWVPVCCWKNDRALCNGICYSLDDSDWDWGCCPGAGVYNIYTELCCSNWIEGGASNEICPSYQDYRCYDSDEDGDEESCCARDRDVCDVGESKTCCPVDESCVSVYEWDEETGCKNRGGRCGECGSDYDCSEGEGCCDGECYDSSKKKCCGGLCSQVICNNNETCYDSDGNGWYDACCDGELDDSDGDGIDESCCESSKYISNKYSLKKNSESDLGWSCEKNESIEVCVDCLEDADCSAGEKCCKGEEENKCYNPESETCCGIENCEFLRSDVCYEKNDICYITGPNTKCMTESQLDTYNSGVASEFEYGKIACGSYSDFCLADTLKAHINTQIFDFAANPGTMQTGLDYPALSGNNFLSPPFVHSIIGENQNIVTKPSSLSLKISETDNSMIWLGVALDYDTRRRFEKYQTGVEKEQIGVEKVLVEGEPYWRGRHKIIPTSWSYEPIYSYFPTWATIFHEETEIIPLPYLEARWNLKGDWTINPYLATDFERAIYGLSMEQQKDNFFLSITAQDEEGHNQEDRFLISTRLGYKF